MVAEAGGKEQTQKSQKSMIRENKNAKIAKNRHPWKFNSAKIKVYMVWHINFWENWRRFGKHFQAKGSSVAHLSYYIVYIAR